MGAKSKRLIFDVLKEVFDSAFVMETDDKLYLNLIEDDETVQVAISITCPKTPVASDEEKNISDLISRLGL